MSKSWISKPWAAGQIKPPITGKYLPTSALNEHVLNQNFVQVSSIRPVYTAYSKKNNSMFSKAYVFYIFITRSKSCAVNFSLFYFNSFLHQHIFLFIAVGIPRQGIRQLTLNSFFAPVFSEIFKVGELDENLFLWLKLESPLFPCFINSNNFLKRQFIGILK